MGDDTEIIIRQATAEDYDALCAIIDEVDTLHRDRMPHIFQKPPGPVRDREYILGLLADENVGLFVAEIEDRSPACPRPGPRYAAMAGSRAPPPGLYRQLLAVGQEFWRRASAAR